MPAPENSVYFGNLRKAQWVKAPMGGLGASSVGANDQLDYANGGAFVSQSAGSHREFDFSWPTGQESDFRFLREYRDGDNGTGLMYWVDPMAMDVNALPPHVARPELSGLGWPSLLGAGQEPVLVSSGSITRTNLILNPNASASAGTVVVATNLVTNPNAELDLAGVGAYAGTVTRDTVTKKSGAASFKITPNGSGTVGVHASWAITGLVAGAAFQFAYQAYAAVAGVGMHAYVDFKNAAGAIILTIGPTGTALVVGAFVPISSTATVPALATQATVYARFNTDFTPTASQIVYIDEVQAGTPSAYFDGSTLASGDNTYAWTGAANASTSQKSLPGVASSWVSGQTLSRNRVEGRWWVNAPAGTYTYAVAGAGVTGKFYAVSLRVKGAPGTVVSLTGTDNISGYFTSAGTATIPASGEVVLIGTSTTAALPGSNLMFGTNSSAALMLTEALLEEVSGTGIGPGSYFDGSTLFPDGRVASWAGAANASASTLFAPYAGMPGYAAKYTLSVPVDTVAQRKTVLIIPDTHTLTLGYSGSATGGGVVRVQTIMRSGAYGPMRDIVLLDPAAGVRLNTSFDGSSYSAVLIYMTQTIAGTATISLTGAKAVYSLTGITPVLTGTHVKGLGHSGLRFSSGPTLAYVYYNEDAGKKYVSAAAKFTEVGSWI